MTHNAKSLSRLALAAMLVVSAGLTPRAHGAAADSVVKAVATKLGAPVKWETQCDPESRTDLFTAMSTGRRYLARLDGGQLALSQPLTGRHVIQGEQVDCSTTQGAPGARDDAWCLSTCARGPAGLRYHYTRHYDFTKREVAEGRAQYWFDVRHRDGVFLTRGVSRLLSSNLSVGSGWEIWRYRETADYEAGRYVVEYRKSTVEGENPGFEAEALPIVNQGRIMVAGPELDPTRAFTDFQVVHGKAAWKGASDLSASAQAKWHRNGLAFRVAVKDDKVITGDGIGSDHVELWFARSVLAAGGQGMSTKASQLEIQVTVSMRDGKVMGAVTAPKDREAPLVVAGRFQVVDGGYIVEFEVPAEALFAWGRPSWSDVQSPDKKSFFEGDLLPFTLVVSDADERGKQETLLATSNLKWGRSPTFGRILLSGKHGLPELNRMQAKEEL